MWFLPAGVCEGPCVPATATYQPAWVAQDCSTCSVYHTRHAEQSMARIRLPAECVPHDEQCSHWALVMYTEQSCSCSCEGEWALQSYHLGVDVPENTEAEKPTVLEDSNQETVNRPPRVTVLVWWPVSTCQWVNRRTRLRQRNCHESVSSEFGNSEWVCRRSWALKSYDSAERWQLVKTHRD
jgi:hypothetical protein